MAKMKYFVPFLLSWEGGFSNDRDDTGGPTQHGVTLDYYRGWCDRNGRPRPSVSDLKLMTVDTWLSIVKEHWDRCNADLLSQSVANLLVDTLWSCGTIVFDMVNRAGGTECRSLIKKADAEHLNSLDQEILFQDLHEARKRYYERICQKDERKLKFINGWLRRLNSITYGKLYNNR